MLGDIVFSLVIRGPASSAICIFWEKVFWLLMKGNQTVKKNLENK